MVFSATSSKDSLSNISIFQKIADPNVIGRRYLKVKGSNQLIDLATILTAPPEVRDESSAVTTYGVDKFANKETILVADLAPTVIHPDGDAKGYTQNLLDLINTGKIEEDKEIRIKHDGKTVVVEPALYHMLGAKDEAGASTQEYYVTENNTLLEKEKITPPAFKTVESYTAKMFKGEALNFDMIKAGSKYYRGVETTLKFNAETGSYDAIIKKNDNPSKAVETTRKVSSALSGSDDGELKVAGVATAKVTSSAKIGNVEKNDENRYTVYNKDGTVDYHVFAGKEPNVVKFYKKVNGKNVEISFVEGKTRKKNGISVKSLNFKFDRKARDKGEFVFDLEIQNMDNVIIENEKVVGLVTHSGASVKFSEFPFKVRLKGNLDISVDKTKLQSYNASKVFETKDGKSEVVADVIQTGPINENGECVVYDYQERVRVFEEFERNIKECKRIAKLEAPSLEDLAILATLQKKIDEQLGTLGDLEAAKEIEEKRRILEEEKAKTGADRDAAKIEEAQKAYNEALSKIGYYKDKNHLADIDTLIARYQKGEFFPTFFIDENGNKVEINSGDITTISSNLPYDWTNSKAVNSLIGKDKITFNKKTGKAEVGFNSNAKEVAVGALKISGLLLNLSFGSMPIGLLLMPFAVPAAAASLAVSAAVATGELVRSKVKQSKINRMTPDDLKKQNDLDLQRSIEKEFNKVALKYYEDIKVAKRNATSKEELKKMSDQALENLKTSRKAIFSQYMLAAPGIINSKFNAKDKKVTNENIFGFMEYGKRKEELEKGKDWKKDLTIQELMAEAKTRCEAEIATLKKDKSGSALDREWRKERIKQLEIEMEDPKNTFLSENGPLSKRVHYLKKTLKYYRANAADREKMVVECEKKKNDDLKNLNVETVEVGGFSDEKLEEIRQQVLQAAKEARPPELADDTEFLLQGELKTRIEVRADDKDLKEPHEDKQAEKIQEIVKEHVAISEKCAEVVASADTAEAARTVVDLYEEMKSAEDSLKAIVAESVCKHILDDKKIWLSGETEPEARQLVRFVKRLEKQSDKQKLLSELYGQSLTGDIDELIEKLKQEFGADAEVKEMFDKYDIKDWKKRVGASQTNKPPRYLYFTDNEKFLMFLERVEKQENLEKKKEILLKPYRDYVKVVEKKKQLEQERLEREKLEQQKREEQEKLEEQRRLEQERIEKRKKAISKVRQWAIANPNLVGKYIKEIEAIRNLDGSFTEEEVNVALKKMIGVIKLQQQFEKDGGQAL